MIATKQKELKVLLKYLSGEKNIIIVGCGLCATTFQTGGEKQVQELKDKLGKKGYIILMTAVIDAVCDQRQVRLFINKNKKKIEQADSLIVMACGAGVQSFGEFVKIKLHPALDTVFLANEKRLGSFQQFCSLCGDCQLESTDGVCVITRCPKGFINGPCGGSKNGKCEALVENDCVWNLIFKSNEKNFSKKHKSYLPPKKKSPHPQKIEWRK
ncbi:MAG: methylenetetrahydrofolate reductase C-terminal domain-containing protein [Spirochaetes bacterium]|nr:methylenetetrahydrofolate reductase C-terminal domain-containing protein [Spirochaetota bacterium]